MRCMECDGLIEALAIDEEFKMCNSCYGKYLNYLAEIMPEDNVSYADKKK